MFNRSSLQICTVDRGQAWSRKLNENQTAAMIKDTAKPPAERLDKIKNSVR